MKLAPMQLNVCAHDILKAYNNNIIMSLFYLQCHYDTIGCY